MGVEGLNLRVQMCSDSLGGLCGERSAAWGWLKRCLMLQELNFLSPRSITGCSQPWLGLFLMQL